jgi:uncharacterized protein
MSAFALRRIRSVQGRLLVVPGLGDSAPEHWQSWLQKLHKDSVRVVQHDWHAPDLERWSARIDSTLARSGPVPWLAVAHSFGALALVHHLANASHTAIDAALLVAPADPDKFGLGEQLPAAPLTVPATMVLSRNDPWLTFSAGQRWAARWGCAAVDLGEAGHVNVAAGFRTLPLAQLWIAARRQRLARVSRPERAAIDEWTFAL